MTELLLRCAIRDVKDNGFVTATSPGLVMFETEGSTWPKSSG